MKKRFIAKKTTNSTIKIIAPKNDKQAKALKNYEEPVQLLLGSAGTGKTFLGCYNALRLLESEQVKRVVLFRSAVATRNIGFLPGNVDEKTAVFEEAFSSIVNNLFGRDDAYNIYKVKKLINFMPTSFIRGITLDDCAVVVDEAQNMSYHELYSLITRAGENTVFIFCGDTLRQSDIANNGLNEFLRVINRLKSSSIVNFTSNDIVRSSLVKEFIQAEESIYESNNKQ